ncbi:MAG: RNA polymerase sigma factor [Mangrovibacterium sp.]
MIPVEQRLLTDLKDGDQKAFEELFGRYSRQLFQFSLNFLKSKEAAEDIVQESFIRIWDNRMQIRTDSSFQSYLFTIALNAIRKHFNRLSKSKEIRFNVLTDLLDETSVPDERNDFQFLMEKLDELIAVMPETRREVFVKKKLEGKSLREIADEMNFTTKSAEYHITQAMKFLRAEFEKLQIKGIIFYYLFIR